MPLTGELAALFPTVPLSHASSDDEDDGGMDSIVICELAAVFAVLTVERCRVAAPVAGLPLLIPPLRYHIVEAGVYRGGYPVLCNFRFMKRLNLRTIISLIPEEPSQDLKDFCSHEKINIAYTQSEKFKESPVLYMPEVTQVLEALIDPSKHPVYLHCLDGGHNSGSVVIALRKLQGWDKESISAEHFRWTNDREITSDERAYIEGFHSSCQTILPHPMPKWLWGGTFLEDDGTRKRSKAFSRLKYPDPVGDLDIKLEREASAVVGSLNTLYDTKQFLTETLPPCPQPSAAALPYDTLWSTQAGGPQADCETATATPKVALNRLLEAFWIDPGPAVDAYIERPQRRQPPAASSYSDLSKLISLS